MEASVTEDSKGRRRVASPCLEPCAIEKGMRILGGKWTGSLLWHINEGPVRFNDLARMVGGASKKMITERLRFLETKGLISRHVRETSPVVVEYAITPLGETAIRVLDELREWSESLPEGVVDQ
ncbi:helix-turn-helix transcriptional regulator [Halomonas sp. DP8Y7-1]|uniref:winged helix-turn-helix transcriptional regulator n=2 Tax=Halomonas TaxID=2745 RepID=UPI001A8EAA1B|nr:helix-turn-helix transcriptional regulator [Halomonas litopenaei]MBY6029499.1 helix-turn-helix transcriptional regulator [Halomonas sp. DP8Y7-1]